MPAGAPSRLDAFASWLGAYGDAWERADADEMAGLFVLGATYQPAPFAPLVRGRRAIGDHGRALFDGMREAQFRAQVLGVGDTYGAAHFRVSYRAAAGSRMTVRDGILLAALDPRGRCTSLREWSHETTEEQPPPDS